MSAARTVNELTLGGAVALDRRRDKLGLDELTEMAQQFQVAISGSASSAVAWRTVELVFDIEFMGATEQRYSNLVRPHFNCGVVLESGLVIVHAHVSAWGLNDLGFYEGADVKIAVFDPDGGPTSFEGFVDLTFQGYGAPMEVQSEDLSVG